MTWMSIVKTNVKNHQKFPAVAYFSPENFSLNYYHQGKAVSVDSTDLAVGYYRDIENKITAVLNRVEHNGCALIIILCAQLVLYSEQIFPGELSDPEIGELLEMLLLKRADSGEILTFYDYFLLKHTQTSSVYGLIEARKDLLTRWMKIFENDGFSTIAVVSQPIILINYMMRNMAKVEHRFVIVCLLSARIFIAHVDENRVEKITEHVTSTDLLSANSIASLIVDYLDEKLLNSNHPVIILDTINCGIAEELAVNFRIYQDFPKEQVLGENTVKWLRAENDMYQSVALA